MQLIPIDQEIARVKQEIEQRRLQLRQIKNEIANIRAHYQQKHVHGGGQIGGIIRAFQQGGKDAQLRNASVFHKVENISRGF